MTRPRETDPPQAPLPIVVALGLVLVTATGGYFLYNRSPDRPPDVAVLTQEAAAYLPNLQLAEVEMRAAENYLKQTVTTISGQITNAGPRTVRLVEIQCVFQDPYGQVVRRERVAVVGRRTGPVASGQTRPFRLAFDNIPESWNQALPALVIVQIQFEQ